MSSERQSARGSATTTPTGASLQRQCACGQHTAGGGECAACQQHRLAGSLQRSSSSLAINRPGDRYEQEAERVAASVTSGGALPGLAFSSVPMVRRAGPTPSPSPRDPSADERRKYPGSSLPDLGFNEPKNDQHVQQPPEKPETNEDQLGKAGEKLADAFLATPFGQEISDKIEQFGAPFTATLPSTVVSVSAAIGIVAAVFTPMYLRNEEIPIQLPAIKIAPGLKVRLAYKGPAQAPTEATITFIYDPKTAKKPEANNSDRYRAETERIATDQAKFQEGVKTPAERIAEQRERDDYLRYRAAQSGNILGIPGLTPRRDDAVLQRDATGSGDLAVAPPIVDDVLRSPGQPLDSATRAFMEPRFGHDFSAVRVHTDGRAAESARAVQANAYTVGNHIAFGAGKHAPQSSAGQRLMAHELAHVVQQGRGGAVPQTAHEAEAQHIAHNVEVSTAQSGIHQSSGIGIAREPIEQPKAGSPRSLGNIVLETAISTVVSLLPGGGLPSRMMSAAMYHFAAEIISQLKGDTQSGGLKAAFAELMVPSNAVDFVSSYTAGAVAGLISPVADLLGLGALAEQLPRIATNLAKNAWEKISELSLSTEAHAIGAAFGRMYSEAKSKFAELGSNPAAIFTMLDSMQAQAIAAAGSAGSSAAKTAAAYFRGKDEEPEGAKASSPQESMKDALSHTQPEERSGVLSFLTSKATRLRKAAFTTPWQKIGYNVGYAMGAIVVNGLLLAATQGIGNLIVEVSAGLGKLAPLLSGVEKALIGLGGRIAEIEKAIAALVGMALKPLSGASKWAEPLLKPLSELMERLGGFVRKLLGLPEKAIAAKGAGVTTKAVGSAAESIEAKAVSAKPKVQFIEPKALPPDSKVVAPPAAVEVPKAAPKPSPAVADSPPAVKAAAVVERPPQEVVTFVKDNPNLIKGKPGQRRASVGQGHKIVEIPDQSLPSGIGCELHSPPPHIKVPCPPGMGKAEKITPKRPPTGKAPFDEPLTAAEKRLTPEQLRQKHVLEAFEERQSAASGAAKDVPSAGGKSEPLNDPLSTDTLEPRTRKQAGVSLEEDHHIATRYRNKNKAIFKRAGSHIDDDLNLIKEFPEHGQLRGSYDWKNPGYKFDMRGHHPDYNNWVSDTLANAIPPTLPRNQARARILRINQQLETIIRQHPEVLSHGPDILPPHLRNLTF